jgi:hypothetical protein
VLALLGSLAGCGSGGDTDSAFTSSPSAAPSTSEAETTAPSTTSTSRPSVTSSAPATTTAGSTTSGGPLGTEDAGRQLTLADFFQPADSWEEERYDIAGQQDLQGIGIELPYCTSAPFELELRLQNNFDQLEFSVGQADDSEISDQEVVVEVLANNAQVDIRTVPFNQVQPISVPVSGVNALKLRFAQNDELDSCSGSVTAVLTDVTVR